MKPVLVLFSREACHLCAAMEAELRALLDGRDYELRIEDVESSDEWLRDYGLRIPVLTTADGRELCEVRLNAAAVLHYVANASQAVDVHQ